VNRYILVIALICISSSTMAEDQKPESAVENSSVPKQTISEPVVRIVREGRTCYKETTIEKMVEACYEGKAYSSPMTEKSRVKIKCPAK
jgi:hypothetical protein